MPVVSLAIASASIESTNIPGLPNIAGAELKAGDVLLYHGTAFLSRLIRFFDGSAYSHASLWTGSDVLEAIGPGVVGRTLKDSVDGAEYVHVYRYRDNGGVELGNSTVPLMPLTTQMDRFRNDGDRYAYEQLLLLALLCATRRVKPLGSVLLARILREVLDSAAGLLGRIMAAGKEPMICSELVYRCFNEASPEYQFRIHGLDLLRSGFAKLLADTESLSAFSSEATEDVEVNRAASNFLKLYQAAKVPIPPALGVPVPLNAMKATSAVADFVTPADLSRSPNLKLIGTLSY